MPPTQIEKPKAAAAAAVDLAVTGMTCAACQSRVQRALAAEPGVVDASVNLVPKTAAVRYDPAAVSPERLLAAVRATGFDADLTAPDVDVLAASAGDPDEARVVRTLLVGAPGGGEGGAAAPG